VLVRGEVCTLTPQVDWDPPVAGSHRLHDGRQMFEDYLARLEEPERSALTALIDHVARIVPDATEGFSYGLPAFRYRDKPLLGFAAAKQHIGLYPFSPSALDAVRVRLTGFKLSKGTIRFSAEHPVPDDVLSELVQARMAEIERA
jgi:uncharacterized protein YdhG (YjbR/CyaY superfamily)